MDSNTRNPTEGFHYVYILTSQTNPDRHSVSPQVSIHAEGSEKTASFPAVRYQAGLTVLLFEPLNWPGWDSSSRSLKLNTPMFQDGRAKSIIRSRS